jgi:predicted transcriptional regulator
MNPQEILLLLAASGNDPYSVVALGNSHYVAGAGWYMSVYSRHVVVGYRRGHADWVVESSATTEGVVDLVNKAVLDER